MAERFDITLGGRGYMVAPGSYRRQQAGGAAVAAGLSQAQSWGSRRVVQRAWRGGLQSQQEEPDRFWTSVGLRPLAGGQAVGPGPRERAPIAVAGLDPTAPRHGVLVNGQPYFAAGEGLWRVDRAGGLTPDNLGGCTQLGGPLGVPAAGLAVRDDSTLFVARAGSDLWSWPIGGGAFATYPLKFNGVAVYAGGVWGLGSLTEPSRLLRVTDLGTAAVDGIRESAI
ncbi:MAG TPA: hypothetical protein VFL91_01575 [Thermomicrobiales bacterium]|nr:hypothetical protein [Thermomicrobiales bacterium]